MEHPVFFIFGLLMGFLITWAFDESECKRVEQPRLCTYVIAKTFDEEFTLGRHTASLKYPGAYSICTDVNGLEIEMDRSK